MTGIVVVSHSRALAEAVVRLAEEMAAETDVPLAFAGGVSGGFDGFGTDATDVMAAIESVANGDGVVVLADMGSALLSAEMAVDLLDGAVDLVRIIPAPLVEGTMAAAVAVSLGRSIDQVVAEAVGALTPKQAQLGAPVSGDGGNPAGCSDSAGESRVFVVDLRNGLHARPAVKLIRTFGEYGVDATVSNLTKVRGPASGLSLNQISSLEITRGNEMLVRITGPRAAEAIDAIDALVADHFGETDDEPVIKGSRRRPDGLVSLSPGYAIGPATVIDAASLDIPRIAIADPSAETERFERAIAAVEAAMRLRISTVTKRTSRAEAEIFEAHIALLQDPDLVGTTRASIVNESIAAESAWAAAARTIVQRYDALEDQYLQIRATDVKDVAGQVLAALDPGYATTIPEPERERPWVLCARELTPSQTAGLDSSRIAAIVTEQSGSTSHTAIIARALGIPAIGGIQSIDTLRDASTIAVDAFEPRMLVDPADPVRVEFEERRSAWVSDRRRLRDGARRPAVTEDGVAIDVLANITGFNEVEAALENGAEGVGLYRTEFLYVDRDASPTVDEQIDAFSRVFSAMGGRPIVVRTFDVGGDKQIPYFTLEEEENPFLGVRGIRLYDDFPEVFAAHLEAILRSARGFDVSVMFPMVSKVEELGRAREIAEAMHTSLVDRGIEHAWPIPIGVMIETPASVLVAEHLADHADFFSIGTNDLTQYLLAAERGSRRLSGFLDSLEPSVLRAVNRIADIGRERGVPVSVCGEIGARIEAIPLLIALGITKISAGGSSIPAIKEAVRATNRDGTRAAIEGIVSAAQSATEVRKRLASLLDR